MMIHWVCYVFQFIEIYNDIHKLNMTYPAVYYFVNTQDVDEFPCTLVLSVYICLPQDVKTCWRHIYSYSGNTCFSSYLLINKNEI